MYRIVCGLLIAGTALTPSSLWAQAAPPPRAAPQAGPAEVKELLVAPNAPKSAADAVGGTTQTGSAGAPANICLELAAFLEKRAATPPAGGQQGGAAAPPQATAPAASPPAPSAPAPQASGASPPAPGQDAPAVDRPQHFSGITAPVPNQAPSTPAPIATLEQVRAHAQANDLRGCQDAARQMRRAGVALPDPLLALAALRPELLGPGSGAR